MRTSFLTPSHCRSPLPLTNLSQHKATPLTAHSRSDVRQSGATNGDAKTTTQKRDVSTQTASIDAPHHTAIPEQDIRPATEKFSWTKQWYPLAAVLDMDPTKPHAQMLLGEKLVLWRDKDLQWRCFEDVCPHRLVPLSEGRIDEADGTLMCGYHGWTFQGDGRPVKIPQIAATSKSKAERTCNNIRACAITRPTQVEQGLIWVWGESGPLASIEAATSKLPISTFIEKNADKELTPLFEHYVRDLPGGFEVWTENMQDQSHVAFAHHGVAGHRGGEKEGYFVLKTLDNNPKEAKEEGSAFKFEFEWTMDGKAIRTTELFFKPPCLTSFWTKDIFSLYIYAVPVSTHQTRLIINAWANFPDKNKILSFARQFKSVRDIFRMKTHLTLNKVNCGDAVFMTGQHRATGRTATMPGAAKYFLPGDNDKGTAAWLHWLERIGKGGPKYNEPLLTGEAFWDDTGKLKRRSVLDNYTQHTQHCSACSRVLNWVRLGQKGCLALFASLFLGAAALLGRGYAIYSPPLAAIAGTAAFAAAIYNRLRAQETELTFTDWHQSDT